MIWKTFIAGSWYDHFRYLLNKNPWRKFNGKNVHVIFRRVKELSRLTFVGVCLWYQLKKNNFFLFSSTSSSMENSLYRLYGLRISTFSSSDKFSFILNIFLYISYLYSNVYRKLNFRYRYVCKYKTQS